jgi:phosphatidylinositol alpha 1,6-mannosyltransferase
MTGESLRIAYFPDNYHEVDGVANTSRHFEAFARAHNLPFLMVHAGPTEECSVSGSVTKFQLQRGPLSFALDGNHQYDLLFQRHYRKLARLMREFRPDVIQITGPSDVGTLGAMIAHRLHIPLAASWQTNLPQYARSRSARMLSFLPKATAGACLDAVENWSFRATARFYKIPRLLFAPNLELVSLLRAATGKPCCLMSHSVDTERFNPRCRDRAAGPFRIGYVGRLTAEKNVRWLVSLERLLLKKGYRDFRFVVVGEGAEEHWLRKNMQLAEFTGVLTGEPLWRAFANMDVLAFPSMTDTFGLVVLEALASGVPAIVTTVGGPKCSVQPGKTGYIADGIEEFADYSELLMTQPALLASMRIAAREYALSTSWDAIFEGVYRAYRQYLSTEDSVGHGVLGIANS